MLSFVVLEVSDLVFTKCPLIDVTLYSTPAKNTLEQDRLRTHLIPVAHTALL